ncbi:MAG TPA: hypothetical protein VNU68_23140 [Verrucomicrobiae bacterium]|nr:hypothetical protein [Verrucomicrobiae bacterium]
MQTKNALTAGLLWVIVAAGVSWSGLLGRWPMPFPQVVLVTLTVLLLIAFARVSSFRRWTLQVDPRAWLALHLSRVIGLYFIYLHFRSELPYAFAIPGGIGDTAAAATAGALLLIAPRPLTTRWQRWIWLGWNAAGLADLAFVVVTAARLGIGVPGSMNALTRFPLGLLPTFLVPLLIMSHVILFVRLASAAAAPNRAYVDGASQTPEATAGAATEEERRRNNRRAHCATLRRRAAQDKNPLGTIASVSPKKTFAR